MGDASGSRTNATNPRFWICRALQALGQRGVAFKYRLEFLGFFVLGFIRPNLIIKAQTHSKSNFDPEFNSEETLATHQQNVPDCRCSLAVGLVLKCTSKQTKTTHLHLPARSARNQNPALEDQMPLVWKSGLKQWCMLHYIFHTLRSYRGESLIANKMVTCNKIC